MSATRCDELVKDAARMWREDIEEIKRHPLQALLNDFDKVYRSWQEYRDQCFSNVKEDQYDNHNIMFSLALLKLSVAIEDKVSREGTTDSRVRDIISMFSEDEKNALREFERFKSLDASPKELADYIVSKREGIYNLVKEAVNKQYTSFDELIESWSKTLKISYTVRRALIKKYRARFRNVVEAIKMLVDQHPAWLKRLFSEYEDALLSSAEVRERFESKVREVFEVEIGRLKSYVERLEEERARLLERLEELSRKASEAEVEKSSVESELARVTRELESLRTKYEETLREWERGLSKLEDLRKRLIEKEKELEELTRRERENAAIREALESEILRLRQLIEGYESKVREYERERERLRLDLGIAEERLREIEENLKGRSEGRLVLGEEAVIVERLFVEKLRSKLSSLPLSIRAPWGEERIDEWSDVKVYYENAENVDRVPRNTRVVFVFEKKGFLGLGERRRIEVRGLYVCDVESVRKVGYVTRRASLSDLAKVINEIPVAGDKTFMLVGIASPTGWDERAIRYVAGGEGPTLITSNLAVFLVDPIENKVYYPEHLSRTHPYIEQLARIFMVEVDIEEENRIERIIRDLCDEAKALSPLEPAFPYSKIYDRLRLASRLSLIRVVYRLREKKVIEIRKGEKESLVVCRGLR